MQIVREFEKKDPNSAESIKLEEKNREERKKKVESMKGNSLVVKTEPKTLPEDTKDGEDVKEKIEREKEKVEVEKKE